MTLVYVTVLVFIAAGAASLLVKAMAARDQSDKEHDF